MENTIHLPVRVKVFNNSYHSYYYSDYNENVNNYEMKEHLNYKNELIKDCRLNSPIAYCVMKTKHSPVKVGYSPKKNMLSMIPPDVKEQIDRNQKVTQCLMSPNAITNSHKNNGIPGGQPISQVLRKFLAKANGDDNEINPYNQNYSKGPQHNVNMYSRHNDEKPSYQSSNQQHSNHMNNGAYHLRQPSIPNNKNGYHNEKFVMNGGSNNNRGNYYNDLRYNNVPSGYHTDNGEYERQDRERNNICTHDKVSPEVCKSIARDLMKGFETNNKINTKHPNNNHNIQRLPYENYNDNSYAVSSHQNGYVSADKTPLKSEGGQSNIKKNVNGNQIRTNANGLANQLNHYKPNNPGPGQKIDKGAEIFAKRRLKSQDWVVNEPRSERSEPSYDVKNGKNEMVPKAYVTEEERRYPVNYDHAYNFPKSKSYKSFNTIPKSWRPVMSEEFMEGLTSF